LLHPLKASLALVKVTRDLWDCSDVKSTVSGSLDVLLRGPLPVPFITRVKQFGLPNEATRSRWYAV